MNQQITNSALGSFRKCPRLYWYQYVLQRVPQAEVTTLKIGTAIHHALAAWWSAQGMRHDAALVALAERAGDIDPETAPKLAAMIDQYAPTLDGRDPTAMYETVQVETSFSDIPVINPRTGRHMRGWSLSGKADGIVRDKSTGEVLILEHKTTSEDIEGWSPYWQRLSIDHQIGLYLQAIGATGVLYDVLRKPGIKFCAKDKGSLDAFQSRCIEEIRSQPEHYYQMRRVLISPADIAEAADDIWMQVHQLSECTKRGRWYRNSDACRGFYGLCSFLGVCTGEAKIDDDALFRTKQEQHEELMI